MIKKEHYKPSKNKNHFLYIGTTAYSILRKAKGVLGSHKKQLLLNSSKKD